MKQKLLILCLFTALGMYAQVGIGTDAPHKSSVLETTSSKRGVLIPRLELRATDDPYPVTDPANSLLVYNTTASGTVTATQVSPGYYYWSVSGTTGKWVRLSTDVYTAGQGMTLSGTEFSRTGLEEVTEGGNTGWRLIGRDPNNYGDIGKNATDLSTQTNASTSRGATGENAFATGYNTTASGTTSTAMGNNTKALGNYSIATGFNTTASGTISTAMGGATTASGDYSTAMGIHSIATATASTAMGYNTKALGDSSTAMGKNTTASGTVSTAMGYETKALGGNSTAMGLLTTASGPTSTVMGYLSIAGGDTSTAIGYQSTASAHYTTAMGYASTASGQYSVAIGNKATASGTTSLALGEETVAGGSNSTAMGRITQAMGQYATSMGVYTKALGTASTAMGEGTSAESWRTTALGSYNTREIGAEPTDYGVNERRLLVVGNGRGAFSGDVGDAFTILRNAKVGIDINNFETTYTTASGTGYGHINDANVKLQVNGTAQMRVLPKGGTNSYTPNKTVVADHRGVLGYVEGLPPSYVSKTVPIDTNTPNASITTLGNLSIRLNGTSHSGDQSLEFKLNTKPSHTSIWGEKMGSGYARGLNPYARSSYKTVEAVNNGSWNDTGMKINPNNRDMVRYTFNLHNTNEVYRVNIVSNSTISASGGVAEVPAKLTIFIEKLD